MQRAMSRTKENEGTNAFRANPPERRGWATEDIPHGSHAGSEFSFVSVCHQGF